MLSGFYYRQAYYDGTGWYVLNITWITQLVIIEGLGSLHFSNTESYCSWRDYNHELSACFLGLFLGIGGVHDTCIQMNLEGTFLDIDVIRQISSKRQM